MTSQNLIKGLVTIAIPAYKSKWLGEAIESALNQDYENIELIIVDDHSPQNLEKIVTPYLADKRVRYYYNEKNLGKESIVQNWNKCVDLAKGEFFVLLCDDDTLMPNFVSSLLELGKKYSQCKVFHGRRILKYEEIEKLEEDSEWPEYEDYDLFLENKLARKREHTITEFLYRTENIKEQGYIDFPLAWGSDDATILSVVKQGGIASSKEVLACFRLNEEHISNKRKFIYQKAVGWICFYKWFLGYEGREKYRNRIINEFDWFLHSLLNRASFVEKVMILKVAPSYLWSIKQKIVLLLH